MGLGGCWNDRQTSLANGFYFHIDKSLGIKFMEMSGLEISIPRMADDENVHMLPSG